MSELREYRARRDFSPTAEPRCATRPSKKRKARGSSYVIQKHAARHLHYDFRLELDGVLLSWAVPKGPSLDPAVKRLAIQVEPHPLGYGTFEGQIAEGQYGAGSVIVWDAGSWSPLDDDPRAAYEKGHLVFALNGHKLKGKWHLVRTARGKAGKSWLLFKANDEHADPDLDILQTAPESVITGPSVDQPSKDGPMPRAKAQRAGTDDGLLCHPTFHGLRDDKLATDVHREEEVPREQMPTEGPVIRRAEEPAPSASGRASSVDTTSVKLSNPDKVLYPEVGITKRQLLDYLALVAPRLLPHVRNRPLTLVRCPNGQNRPCFFQKHPNAKSNGMRSVAIREKEGKADYAVIDDANGLFSLVQLGVLEIHTCGSRADDYEHPDILVFDLDPDPSVKFSAVVQCALRLRELFSAANLESFVKTTGGKGLHVCVPIDPRLSWTQAKAFTKNLANALVAESPQLYVATASKELRRGKIFIDYLRNGRGATFVAPYSMRAHPAATVATPLFWEELTTSLKPEQFTVRTIPERVSRLESDPFQQMATLRQKLPGI